jgi:general secretion pathway protein A
MYEDYFGFKGLPFSVTPDPRFFYNNSVYREAFASLRHGIEARKGFVLITGEVGTGKTTLLKVFMRSAESTIHTAFIFNPKLNLTELLRAILNDLEIAHDMSEGRASLLDKLNYYLIEQLKKGEIVALLVDEAQNLSDELLEELRLLSNLETTKDKLLQIVLMGQPELEEKLEHPELRQLKQRIALRCRLAPLKSGEVNQYIDSRLNAVGYDGKELFSIGALEKIILYSKGIPRLINMICDNALLITYAASKKKVSAEVIDEVTRDLQLRVPAQSTGTPTGKGASERLQPPRQRDEARMIQDSMPSTWVSRRRPGEFQDYFIDVEPPPREFREKRKVAAFGMGTLFGFAIAVGMGAVFYAKGGGLAVIADRIETQTDERSANQVQARLTQQETKQRDAVLSEPPAEEQPGATQDLAELPTREELTPVTETSEPPAKSVTTPEVKQIAKEEKKNRARINAAAKRPAEDPVLTDAPLTNEKLEFEVYKAIYNRAIQGVEVSVRDGTVYLRGRVATERQKLAAALAARNVPGVKNVRDQITVNYGVSPRYTDARSRTPG